MRNIFWALLPLFIPWLSLLFSPSSIVLVNAGIVQREDSNLDNEFDNKASVTSNHYLYSKEDVDILVRFDLQSEQIVVDINLFNNFDDVMIFVSDENQEILCETSMQPKYFQRTSCGFPTPSHLKEGGNFVDVTMHSIPEDAIVYRERHYFFHQANGLLTHKKRKDLSKKHLLSSITFMGLLALGPYAFWRHQQQQNADEATIVSPNDSSSPHSPGSKFPPTSSLSSPFSSSSPQLTMRVPSANLLFLFLQWLLSRPQRLVQALLDALHVSTPIGTSPAINVPLTVSPLPSTKTPLSLPASPIVTKEPEDTQPLFSGWYSTKPSANNTTKNAMDENTRTINENNRSSYKNGINDNDKPQVGSAIDSSAEEKKRSFTVLTLAALSPVRNVAQPIATAMPPVPSITRSTPTVVSKENKQLQTKKQVQPPAAAQSIKKQPKTSSLLYKFLPTTQKNDDVHRNKKNPIVDVGKQQTTVTEIPSPKRSLFFHNWLSFKDKPSPTSQSAVSLSSTIDSKPAVMSAEPKKNWKRLLRPLLVTVAVLVVLTQAPQQLHTLQTSSQISSLKNHLDAKLTQSWQQLQSLLLRNRLPVDASASTSTASSSTIITPSAEPTNHRTAVASHSTSSPIQRPSSKRFSTTTLSSPVGTQIRTLTSQSEKPSFFPKHAYNHNPKYFPRLAIGSDALPLSNADLRLFQEVDNCLFVRRKTRMSQLGHNVHQWGQHVSRVAYLLAGQGMVTMLCWWGKLKPSSKTVENHAVDTNSPSNIHYKERRNHVTDTRKATPNHPAFFPPSQDLSLRPTNPNLTLKPNYEQKTRSDGLTITSSEADSAVDETHEAEMDDGDYDDDGEFDETAAPHKATKDTML